MVEKLAEAGTPGLRTEEVVLSLGEKALQEEAAARTLVVEQGSYEPGDSVLLGRQQIECAERSASIMVKPASAISR